MPRAPPLATRQDIVERHLRGQTLAQIATDLGIAFVTVRALWRAFRDRGSDGLAIGYHACGSSTPAYPEVVLRRACRLKREHPKWGAGRIRVELLEHLEPSGDSWPCRVRDGFNEPGAATWFPSPRELWPARLP